MQTRFSSVQLVGAASIALGFAACSGMAARIAPSGSGLDGALVNSVTSVRIPPEFSERRVRGSLRYDVKKARIFVANSADNRIEIYDPNLNDPSPFATITEGVETPAGVCLDKNRTLYVVDGNRNHISIQEYKKGETAPYQAITSGLSDPAFCAVDSAGNLWVTNTSGGNVTEYPQGSTIPSKVIKNGIAFPIGIAFDRKGDMFVANRPGGSRDNVQVYRRGATSPSMTISDGITEPAGIAVDSKGTLYVSNLGYNTVPEYKAGQNTPYQTITDGIDYPVAATVNKRGTLFVTNFSSNTITEYAPGSIYPSEDSISQSLDGPAGIAYSPPLLPQNKPRGNVSQEALSDSDLLYVTNETSVYVYTYPRGRLVQEFQYAPLQSPAGDCIDDRGNVFITGSNHHDVLVYSHGASEPKTVLWDPGYPMGCSIDPTTQNLAVANYYGPSAGAGNVAIWDDPTTSVGSGGPTFVYSNLQFTEPTWCAYDDKGNLFVDGGGYSQRKVSLAELPKGATSFENISVGIDFGWPPGDVQWDGQYITISAGNVVYELSFSGSTGYVVGSRRLPLYWSLQGYSVAGAWQKSAKRTLIATAGGSIGFFRYPTGRGPTKTLLQSSPLAPVVSPAAP
jgi:sugar lactone lactonase YvrE